MTDDNRPYEIYVLWQTMNDRTVEPRLKLDLKHEEKFVRYMDKTAIAFPDIYLRLMKRMDVQKHQWTINSWYPSYIISVDTVMALDHLRAAQTSIQLLQDLAAVEGVELKDIPAKLTAGLLVQLIHTRELSPWVAFTSPVIRDVLVNADQFHKTYLHNGRTYNRKLWERALSNEKKLSEVKQIVEGMGL